MTDRYSFLQQYRYTLALILLVALFTGCVTQKKKGDLTKMQKLYHNTTSRYNGYFNASILYDESILALNDQYQDNYNKILPVYKYIEADDPKQVSEDLDKAIKKVSVVVSLHREADWVDDCYLLMGKAQFAKQDYESAQEALEYMVAEFNPDAIAKKKTRKLKKATKKNSSSKKSKKKKKKAVEKKKKDRKKSKKKAKKKKKKAKSKKSTDKAAKTIKETSKKAEKKAKKEVEEEVVKAEDPKKNYFLKHRPAYQEGVLWLAKTYVERENFLGAERLFQELDASPHLFKEVKAEVAPAKAYYYLELGDKQEAIAPLKEAISLADDKEKKARYAYIIAQIHEAGGNSTEALASFEQAKKFSNNYELEFSSGLNVLKSSMRSGKISAMQAEKQLEKMLKETKNNEYQDQIYFVLADIAIQAQDKKKAIDYLASSLETNSLNKAQKGESHLLLADLYFEEGAYVDAKTNYDAALGAISKNDDRYLDIKKLGESLTDIAKNIEIITLQDSLLQLSELSDKDKRKLAAKMKRQQAEAALAATKQNQPTTAKKGPNTGAAIPRTLSAGNFNSQLGGSSNFFAYSDKLLKKGRRDFDRNWAGRTLQDNWRRSEKSSSSFDGDISEVASYEEALTDDEITSMLKGVPNTEEEKQKLNDMIMTAYYELGTLYRDRLSKNQKAVETLEKLNDRYPGSKHELNSWYFLYLAHGDLGNEAKKQEYFQKILDNYGNSVYARVLQDPEYLSKSQSKETKINSYYNETYALFTDRQYEEVQSRIKAVPSKFGGNNSHQPRFALLNAMSLGNLESKEVYIKSLKELIGRFPSTPEEKRAKELLRLLGDQSIVDAGLLEPEKVEKANEIFKIEDDNVHYGIIVFEGKSSLTRIKASVSDYNRKFHKLDQLRISNIYLGSDTNRPLIIIRKFKNKNAAMKYYDGVRKDITEYIKVQHEYDFFVVNQYNYREILRNQSAVEYKTFFAKHYLEN